MLQGHSMVFCPSILCQMNLKVQHTQYTNWGKIFLNIHTTSIYCIKLKVLYKLPTCYQQCHDLKSVLHQCNIQSNTCSYWATCGIYYVLFFDPLKHYCLFIKVINHRSINNSIYYLSKVHTNLSSLNF